MSVHEICETCGDPHGLRYGTGYILTICPDCDRPRPVRNLPPTGPTLGDRLRRGLERVLEKVRR